MDYVMYCAHWLRHRQRRCCSVLLHSALWPPGVSRGGTAVRADSELYGWLRANDRVKYPVRVSHILLMGNATEVMMWLQHT